jgi:uncharacterized protein YndB with AHSA1/START domain
MNAESRTRGGPKVVFERTYRASVEEVWNLWTTKEGFESWWGPQGFRADVHEIDPRVGGTLEYDMVADTPEMVAAMKSMGRPPSHATHARFAEVTPRAHLVIVNVIDFLPGVATYEATITVDLFPVGDGVRMVVGLDPMHSEQFTQMQKEGFASQLTKLDERFEE